MIGLLELSYGIKKRARTVAIRAKLEQKVLRLCRKEEIGQRLRPGVIGLGKFFGIRFHDDKGPAHYWVVLHQDFHSVGRHAAHFGRDIANNHIGII